MSQLIFDLPRRVGLGRTDFFVSPANATALAWIDRWPEWPSSATLVHGAAGAGKTHLAHLWCERATATLVSGRLLHKTHVSDIIENRGNIAVDDADNAAEPILLQLINACAESAGSLLLTSDRAASIWRVALPDLCSRLRAMPSVAVGEPDDTLLGAVLVKQFADRQIRVAPEVIIYLIRHIERSLAAACATAAALDRAALQKRSAITIPLAQQVLAERADQLSSSDAGVA